ncbi:MAG: ammonium transporter [Gemmataceae bacterium]|nr:ammonium transporter [Gemmataceae bacterium]MCI0742472.1 ammonium transporter [Gemmataceae bacterium]
MKTRLFTWLLAGVVALAGSSLFAQEKLQLPEELQPPEKLKPAEGEKQESKKDDEPSPVGREVQALNEAQEAKKAAGEATVKADTAWMLTSSALVMLMVPGLALFYAGMVRRKNVLATMMQSMIALAVVGVFWIAIGYNLAFGQSWRGLGIIGWSEELIFLGGVMPEDILPKLNIPVYAHVLFQGMFAIITPALISGAFAERIRFGPYLLFILLWVTLVYCPLAHMVWAMNWFPMNGTDAGSKMIGLLGMPVADGGIGAIDFAGGTVVHIAAGFSALGGILVLRKRRGYPELAVHPNSMVLCLTGAGLLWFGWFGFNGGSAGGSGSLATSAFAATQAAAAAAGLSWVLAEWLHKGKPTALGLASGIVAGLVAVTPASGYILIWGGLVIGLIAGVVCYAAVCLKPLCKYDDSLDVFGVHGVGGFLGAVLTGVFCFQFVNPAGADGLLSHSGGAGQLVNQLKAAAISALFAFAGGVILTKLVDLLFGFATDSESETAGLDRTEHGESGFDFGMAMEATSMAFAAEPKSAAIPPNGHTRFQVIVEGVAPQDLAQAWSDMWTPGKAVPPEFKTVYPHVTTVQGNRFSFRDGEQNQMRDALQNLFQKRFGAAVKARVEG